MKNKRNDKIRILSPLFPDWEWSSGYLLLRDKRKVYTLDGDLIVNKKKILLISRLMSLKKKREKT